MSIPTLGQFPLSTSVLKLGSHLSSIHKKQTYPTFQYSNIAIENGNLEDVLPTLQCHVILPELLVSANGKLLVWVGGLDSWDPVMKGIVT